MDTRFLEIASLLVSKKNLNELMNEVLLRLREIVNADAGSIYLHDEENSVLTFKYTQNDTVNVPFKEFSLPVDENSIVGYVALTKEILHIEDVYKIDEKYPFKFNKDFDKLSGYRTKSMLVIPIFDAKDNLISILQIINKKVVPFKEPIKDFEKEVVPFDDIDEKYMYSLSGIVGVALENSLLYHNIEEMFEGFIMASVQAVESRDPVTKGHTERVYRLTSKIVEEMDKDTETFPDFKMKKDDWRVLKYASLLHDFGKIGVRENVLTKPKKLYDDQMRALQMKLKLYQCVSDMPDEEFEKLYETINRANEPSLLGEDISDKLEELKNIVFKDKMGNEIRLLEDFEYEQLSVKKGTLTEKERKEIESHVAHTYEYLVKIPWTKELKNVPKIACMHHEKLDGSGYPFGLKGDEIHIFGKVMAVADIYDALTSKDRPYKKAVPVVTALKIIKEEAEKGKLDKKIVEFFIEKQIYNKI